MLNITSLRINHQPLKDTLRSHIVTAENLCFSWALQSSRGDNRQTACRVTVEQDESLLWDSGTVETAEQMMGYAGPGLPQGVMLHVHVQCVDAYGETSGHFEEYFIISDIEWKAPWISAPGNRPWTEARYFRKTFTCRKELVNARLYACGIGFQHVLLNGKTLDEAATIEYPLDPAFTDYSTQSQYVLYPYIQDELDYENCLGIIVGLGWRDNGLMQDRIQKDPSVTINLRGEPMLTAMLILDYADGTSETILTDESWTCGNGPIVYNDVYNGTVFDARMDDPLWATAEWTGTAPSAVIAVPCGGYGRLVPMQLPPVDFNEEYRPVNSWMLNGKCYFDFGQNLAGVVRLKLPTGLKAGHKIIFTQSEEQNENGELFTDTLRAAKATDTYIASGEEDDDAFFLAPFTYHGFRYACIEGLDAMPTHDDVAAVAIRNNFDKDSFFTCGNPLINQLYRCCVATERANSHSMLTDCPQRNERMGWLNDATVRFEAFPYAFEADAIFRKIIQDVLNEQKADGAISDTVPHFCFGQFPADPVCSSFLIAGLETYLHYGDTALIRHAFDGFKAWTDCILAHSEDGIVNYSYWGDWAAPDYACVSPGSAESAVTPGVFMSTGYSYFNCRTLSKFAEIIGREDLARQYADTAEKVKTAMLRKWYNAETGLFATASMACIVFPLWLGIYPEETAQAAARRLRDDLVAADYRFTTGNLCTRYLFEVLTAYGYVNEAYTLITKDDYPGFGFMLQQEATTIWERFELKKDGSMNSHNHPMYGAVYRWFFANLAGITVDQPACGHVTVKPAFPDKLQFVHCGMDTVRGQLVVRWFRRYGKLYLHVTVPFGMTADVVFNGKTTACTSGFHVFEA